MQLGMVGLGRMGAGHRPAAHARRAPLRRLRRDRRRGEGARGRRRRRRDLARGVRGEAREAARGLGDGPGGRDHRQDDRRRSPRCSSRATRSSTAATRTTTTTSATPNELREKGIHHVDVRHERRRVGPRARLLPDDRRRGRRSSSGCARSSRRSRRASTPRRARPAARGEPSPAEQGYLHCGPNGAGPLREDGPQRHRVRAHGRVRRGPEHPHERGRGQAHSARRTPRPRRSSSPSTTSTRSTRPRSPRSGGAAASSARGCSTSPPQALLRVADARGVRRPRVRLRRGPLDVDRRDRRGRPGARC